MVKITDHVGADKKVYFDHYQDGSLWYRTDTGIVFEVPCSDFGTGVALPEDKSVAYMRWIRKHLTMVEEARQEQDSK